MHTVQPGDTLWTLALEYGRDFKLMPCSVPGGLKDPDHLQVGQMLLIPAATDVCYHTKQGDTAIRIADEYGVDPAVIVDELWNGIETPDQSLSPGRFVLIHNARVAYSGFTSTDRADVITGPVPIPALFPTPIPPRQSQAKADSGKWPYGDGHFVWPVQGVVSQRYRDNHRAIDIAADLGTPVVAADNGTVILAGWNDQGYGWRVVIDHGNDYVTLYAHLSNYYVSVGDVVEKGEVIGAVGFTGNSTGPHLHFELRDFGYLVDPLQYLPGEEITAP